MVSKKEHIQRMLRRAAKKLKGWIGEGRKLCDLKIDFYGGCRYDLEHVQAIYMLRYYPAYFVENYRMLKIMKSMGLKNPYIASMGCGCMVDAAAAKYVFSNDYLYDGYDLIEWFKTAVAIDDCFVQRNLCNLYDVESFDSRINVFAFPRSLGDLNVQRIASVVKRTVLENDVVFVCGTYPRSAGGWGRSIDSFVGFFDGFEIDDSYHFSADCARRCSGHIRDIYRWFDHSKIDYCTSLFNKCTQDSHGDCPRNECQGKLNWHPMIRFDSSDFKIFKLKRI